MGCGRDSASLYLSGGAAHLTARCNVAEVTESRLASKTSLMGSIFACFVSFEAISQTIGMQNLHVGGQRSLKVFWGKFFGRIRALKSSLKMNQTHSLFFEAADQAKAAA